MTESVAIIGSAVSGTVLGLGYYGALWLTVRRLTRYQRPGFALAVSFGLRSAVVLTVAAGLIRYGSWYGLVALLVGFLCGRTIANELVKRRQVPKVSPSKE